MLELRDTGTVGLLRLRAGSRVCCLGIAHVLALQRADRLLRSAEEDGPVGWTMHHGRRLPVHLLALLLGGATSREVRQEQILLLVQAAPQPYGLLVDQVWPVQRVPPAAVLPLPRIAQDPRAGLFEAAVLDGDELLLQLCPDRLMAGAATPPAPAGPIRPPDVPPRAPSLLPLSPGARGKGEGVGGAGRGKVLIFASTGACATAGIRFVLSVTQVPELLLSLSCTAVPTAPPPVVGLVPWRGRAVPLVDLDVLLGLPADASAPQAQILVARAAGAAEFCAFRVQPGVQVRSLPLPLQPCRRRVSFDPAVTRAIFQQQDELLVLLDVDRILHLGEQAASG